MRGAAVGSELSLRRVADRLPWSVLWLMVCKGRQSGSPRSRCLTARPRSVLWLMVYWERGALLMFWALLAGWLVLGRSTAKPGWSLRRSGIEGALPFRGGAGDNIEVRLAGTPAGRFAAFLQPLPCYKHLLARSGGLARLALFACKKRDSPERTQAGAVDRAWRDLRDGAWEYGSARGGSQAARVACRSVADWLPGPVLGCL